MWVGPLTESLAKVGAPHDFVRAEKTSGGWERNTLRKPQMVERAMLRHPKSTVIFLDVDAVVLGSLSELVEVEADVAMYFAVKRKANGNHGLFARSGTMVLRPTPMARIFVHNWLSLSHEAPRGWVDQSTLLEAFWRTPGVTVGQIDVRYCATRKDRVPDPVVLHHQGSANGRKMPPWLPWLSSVVPIMGTRKRLGA